MKDSLIGMWILEQFRITAKLGSGGMSEVYLAEQPAMDRQAAIKILRAGDRCDDPSQARFRLEARTVSRLSHPNVVTVYNFGELADGTLFLAMEYLDGKGLDELLADGPLPVMRAVNLVYQCASALDYAHSQGVVHRDLKPGNIMVGRLLGRDHIKVLDFGIARIVKELGDTEPGTIVGTPEYLSPEQCAGQQATRFSDQYALGLVFYEMLTGQRAVEAESPLAYLHVHRNVEPVLPSVRRRDLRLLHLDPIVMRLLSKDPEARFAGMDELMLALDRAAEKILGAAEGSGPLKVPAKQLAGPSKARPRPRPRAVTRDALTGGTKLVRISGAKTLLWHRDWEMLRQGGFQIQTEASDAEGAARNHDLALVGLELAATDSVERASTGLPWTPQTVLCVAAPLAHPGLQELARKAHNMVLGPHPVDPLVLTLALRWADRHSSSMLERAVPDRAVQLMQVRGSAHRALYTDTLLQDLERQGARRAVLQAAREVCDELLTTVLDPAAGTQPAGTTLDASAASEGDTLLRWVLWERYLAISVSDRMGNIAANHVLEALNRDVNGPAVGGLGLQIVLRASRALLFFLAAGRTTEVVALIDTRSRHPQQQGWLGFMQSEPVSEIQLGPRLWMLRAPAEQVTRVRLWGEVDGSSDLGPLFDSPGPLVINLRGVTGINSTGIQRWLEAVNARTQDAAVQLEECSLAMVRQLNMVPILARTGAVVSFVTPFCCPRCGRESSEIFRPADIVGLKPPPLTCTACGQPLELDDVAEQYFAFLAEDDCSG